MATRARPGAPASLSEVEAGLARAEQLRRLGRYDDALAARLPGLLRALYVHTRDTLPGTQAAERTHANLCDAYSVIQSVANRYGYDDVVGQAVVRYITAASLSGDPLRPTVAAYRRVAVQMCWGYFDAVQRSLTRAWDGIADIPGAAADAIRVQLALRQSIVAARAGDRDTADELIADARGRVAATALPEAPYPNVIASALNADMHWMAVAMEAFDGTTALDLARAYLLHGNRDRCVDALGRARAISPEHVRYNPSLHDTIATLAAQDARRTDSLTDLPAGPACNCEARGGRPGHAIALAVVASRS